jgi:pilus assembly protein FimV
MKKLTPSSVTRSAVICLLVLFSVNSYGIGLGNIEVASSLNQPLDATIELTGAIDLTANELVIRLASAEVFERMGIPRGYKLTRLKFSPDLTAFPPFISVSSQSPIREPLLVFVLEVQWLKGQMLKEYKVFLNPAP